MRCVREFLASRGYEAHIKINPRTKSVELAANEDSSKRV
jgi:hypothetical protein